MYARTVHTRNFLWFQEPENVCLGVSAWEWVPGNECPGMSAREWVPGNEWPGMSAWEWVPGNESLGVSAWEWEPGNEAGMYFGSFVSRHLIVAYNCTISCSLSCSWGNCQGWVHPVWNTVEDANVKVSDSGGSLLIQIALSHSCKNCSDCRIIFRLLKVLFIILHCRSFND